MIGKGIMRTFRTIRPLLVDATRCVAPMTVMTDIGEREVRPGDWIIHGENEEVYVVDGSFFDRTFAPLDWTRTAEGHQYGC